MGPRVEDDYKQHARHTAHGSEIFERKKCSIISTTGKGIYSRDKDDQDGKNTQEPSGWKSTGESSYLQALRRPTIAPATTRHLQIGL